MKVKILGCGPSNGVPSLSRGYGLCDPKNPRNNRTRSALLIETNSKKNILIDTDPEIRLQLLKANNPSIDAVLYTHSHYDHMGGADDLRSLLYDSDRSLPIYLTREDGEKFKSLLKYLFKNNIEHPIFKLNYIYPYQHFFVEDIKIIPIKQYHGEDISIGYRINDFAYSTDVKSMDEEGFDLLKGIKTWVLGVVTPRENYKHVHLTEAFKWIDRIQPERVFLTHMGQRMDYETLCRTLPQNIQPAYDGLEIDI